MRKKLLLSLLLSGLPLAAQAAPPLDSDEQAAAPPALAPPAPPAAPAPQPMYFNGPVYIIPAYPQGQPAAPPAVAPTPAPYYTPPVVRRAALRRPSARRPEALRYRFGIGARPTGMWVNQRLYNADLLMAGGGPQVRVRLGRHVALEASFDVLRKNVHDGVFDRMSFPIQLAALLYVMPPRPGTHFNVYGAVGAGVMPSRITLDDGTYPKSEIRATELMGQGGVGCELRFGRFSLSADARAVGLFRTGDESYFASFVRPDAGPQSLGLRQEAVQSRSVGWTFSAGAMLWL